jgi:hypothetical protein
MNNLCVAAKISKEYNAIKNATEILVVMSLCTLLDGTLGSAYEMSFDSFELCL